MRGRFILLAALLLAAHVAPSHAIFGWGSAKDEEEVLKPMTAYTPVVARTAYAAQFLQNSTALTQVPALDVPFGSGGQATVYGALPGEAVIVFRDDSLPAADTWTAAKAVPFLEPFVYTSQAPAPAVDAWAPLSNGTATAGELADAVQEVVGADKAVLRVICVGQGAAGAVATLCGPWAALQFPRANADVITFNSSWNLYNPPFAWSFEQLVVLHYNWPFNAPVPASPGEGVEGIAKAVRQLITRDNLPASVRVPNLPAFAPTELQEPGKKTFEEVYAALLPPADLPEQYKLAPSDCPVMLCKTRQLLKASCLGFDNPEILAGLPFKTLHDDRTNADAVVGWDNSTRTAYIFWKYTEEKRDWLTDAAGIQWEGFIKDAEALVPGRVDSLNDLAKSVQTHQGFTNQFESLALKPRGPDTSLMHQLGLLTNGEFPRRVITAGFSLGGGLSELCGMWAAILWPTADILVANQGGPIPGNEDFKLLFEATVGRAYKYSYRMDIVNNAAPLAWYKRVPAMIWVNGSTALLQDRPHFDFANLSWNDHTCDTWLNPENNETIIGYVPRLYNITRPTVPGWVYNATAKDS